MLYNDCTQRLYGVQVHIDRYDNKRDECINECWIVGCVSESPK